MIKLRLLALLLLGTTMSVQAQKSPRYAVQAISEKLLDGSSAVIRELLVDFQVSAPDKAHESVYYAVTVLNAEGRSLAGLDIHYDKLKKANFKSGKIYDRNGSLLRKMKSSDLQDLSAISDFSIYGDNRRLVFHPQLANYPYTVVYEYELDYKGLVHWVNWYPQSQTGVALENARLKIALSNDVKGRFHTVGIPQPVRHSADGQSIWTWQQSQQPAVPYEAYGPTAREILPHVLTAPNDFSYDGYPGSIETWDNLAEWINGLNKDRDALPSDTRNTIHALTDPLPTPREKVAALYQYLQDNFRYVSIQLGIGGYMPFTADNVDQQKYGDCKALSNYMRAMLREVGIRSHYVLVRAGRNVADIETDFPAQQFNHAIVCVPLAEDTLWLECTSQTNPFGFLNDFTSDRHVLLITEDGGQIVHTPRYSASNNYVHRRANIAVQPTGDASINMHTEFSGLKYAPIGLAMRKGIWKKDFVERYGFSGLKIDSIFLSENKGPIPTGHEMARFDLKHYASQSGKRLFVKLHPCPPASTPLSTDHLRKLDLVLKPATTRRDTFIYSFPAGYQPEYLPEPLVAESPFGKYSFSITNQNGKLVCIRFEERFQGRFPPSQLDAYLTFRKLIYQADREKMVWVKQEE